jgi:hypothetical protein
MDFLANLSLVYNLSFVASHIKFLHSFRASDSHFIGLTGHLVPPKLSPSSMPLWRNLFLVQISWICGVRLLTKGLFQLTIV